MLRQCIAAFAVSFGVTSATAAPYCDALLDPNAIGKTYQRIAPIYSDRDIGWIIASDQLRETYALKASALDLVNRIVAEVRSHGVELAILVPPPRPVIAGSKVLDTLLPGAHPFNVRATAVSFHELIAQISDTGAIVPDLLSMLEADPELASAFYFSRDTHWTLQGAAASARALAGALSHAGIDDVAVQEFPGAEAQQAAGTFEEGGSLAKAVAAVCNLELPPEIVPQVVFGAAPAGLGLLDDTPAPTGPKIALLGTSFSDRNKRDAYRVADAIAHTTSGQVDNFSISGGGALSAFEAYVLSGALKAGAHDLVVWEMPYTTAFRSVSELRQLLGALQASRQSAELAEIPLPASGQARVMLPVFESDDANTGVLLALNSATDGTQKLKGTVHYDNGSSTRVSFYRSKRMPAEHRSKPMFMSLDGQGARRPIAIDLTYKPDAMLGSSLSVLVRQ